MTISATLVRTGRPLDGYIVRRRSWKVQGSKSSPSKSSSRALALEKPDTGCRPPVVEKAKGAVPRQTQKISPLDASGRTSEKLGATFWPAADEVRRNYNSYCGILNYRLSIFVNYI